MNQGIQHDLVLNTFLVSKVELVSNLYISHIIGNLVFSVVEIFMCVLDMWKK